MLSWKTLIRDHAQDAYLSNITQSIIILQLSQNDEFSVSSWVNYFKFFVFHFFNVFNPNGAGGTLCSHFFLMAVSPKN